MKFKHTFDEEEYTCEIFDNTKFEFDPKFFKRSGSNSPESRPNLLTSEWVNNEIAKAYNRDSKKDFYNDQERKDGLDDVFAKSNDKLILVFNGKNELFGKINFYEEEKSLTLKVMYLYVFGDRREIKKGKNILGENKFIKGSFIMWCFSSLYARELFGGLARMLICYPRDTIYKNLIQSDAYFVQMHFLGNFAFENFYIKNSSVSMHVRILQTIIKENEDDEIIGSFGALYSSEKLINYISKMERRLSSLR